MAAIPNLFSVDSVTLTVVVDNTVEWMTKFPRGFSSELRGHLTSPDVPLDAITGVPFVDLDHYCCGAHGLSLLMMTEKDGTFHQVLLDTGPEMRSIARNLNSLGLDASSFETIILSHWHRDHSGGILEALGRSKGKTINVDLHPSRPIARGIAVPPNFDHVIARLPEDPTFADIEALGGRVQSSSEPHTVADGTVFVSGEIPRVIEWEEGLAGGVRWVGLDDPRDAVGAARSEGKWISEPHIMDERYVAINVEGRGLVILSACSHAGICNVVHDAVTRFARPIHMILGGLHLSTPDMENRIAPTVKFLAESVQPSPTYVLPMHCTGFGAKVALENAMGEGCVQVGVGTKIVVQGIKGEDDRLPAARVVRK